MERGETASSFCPVVLVGRELAKGVVELGDCLVPLGLVVIRLLLEVVSREGHGGGL